jgi:hypothetical protein
MGKASATAEVNGNAGEFTMLLLDITSSLLTLLH